LKKKHSIRFEVEGGLENIAEPRHLDHELYGWGFFIWHIGEIAEWRVDFNALCAFRLKPIKCPSGADSCVAGVERFILSQDLS